ncbi:hypothetical protein [Psychrobacter piechaudii]|nr:hypothetical protein [Psychrobacter piechaudii]
MCVALYPPPEVGGFTATGDKYPFLVVVQKVGWKKQAEKLIK